MIFINENFLFFFSIDISLYSLVVFILSIRWKKWWKRQVLRHNCVNKCLNWRRCDERRNFRATLAYSERLLRSRGHWFHQWAREASFPIRIYRGYKNSKEVHGRNFKWRINFQWNYFPINCRYTSVWGSWK